MLTLNTYSVHYWNYSNIGFQLVDIRPRPRFREAHLPHADNVPLDEPNFEDRVKQLLKAHRDDIVGDKIVVYGEGGPDDPAHEAATRLRNAGLNAVYEYPDGLQGWVEQHHRVGKGDTSQPAPA